MSTIKTTYRAERRNYVPAKHALAIAREQQKLADSGLPRYPQDAVLTIDGILYTIRIQHDSDSIPFDWECFYGVPTENRSCNYSREREPGQVIIWSERQGWVYDRADAIKNCLLENSDWPRCTRFSLACEAVDAEIEYWRNWLNDNRYFIGISVHAESPDGFEAADSLWGVEAGDSNGYWRSIALDLIGNCKHEITQQRVRRVYALNDALTADFAGIEFAD